MVPERGGDFRAGFNNRAGAGRRYVTVRIDRGNDERAAWRSIMGGITIRMRRNREF
jgi:hypothetical protein